MEVEMGRIIFIHDLWQHELWLTEEQRVQIVAAIRANPPEPTGDIPAWIQAYGDPDSYPFGLSMYNCPPEPRMN